MGKPYPIGCVETGMRNSDEIKALRQQMAKEAAAGNLDALTALQETIEDLEADEEDDYGDEEE